MTGEEAIQRSKERASNRMSQGSTTTRARMLCGASSKTFYLIDGVWTDSEFKAESRLPETALVFGSDEYFALLKQHPKLGSYFALGQRVLVVFEGRVYRVNAPRRRTPKNKSGRGLAPAREELSSGGKLFDLFFS